LERWFVRGVLEPCFKRQFVIWNIVAAADVGKLLLLLLLDFKWQVFDYRLIFSQRKRVPPQKEKIERRRKNELDTYLKQVHEI
jgi:hypothetical protein